MGKSVERARHGATGRRAVAVACALAAALLTVLAASVTSAGAAPAAPAGAEAGRPKAAITDDCSLDGAQVLFINPTRHEVTFTVTKNGAPFGSAVLVAAGEADQVVVPLHERERALIAVAADGEQIVATTVEHRCLDASATVSFDCPATTARVEVGNGGAGGLVLIVTSAGTPVGEPIVLGPGGGAVVDVPIAEDAAPEIVATVDGIELVREVVRRNCQKPAVDAVNIVCARGGAVVDLRNNGVELAWVDVLVDAALAESVAVPPAGVATATVAVADGVHALTAVSNGATLHTATVNAVCHPVPPPPPPAPAPGPGTGTGGTGSGTGTGGSSPRSSGGSATGTPASCSGTTGLPECQEVLGVKLTRGAGSLASTGSETRALAVGAGLALLAGGVALASSARPRRTRTLG